MSQEATPNQAADAANPVPVPSEPVAASLVLEFNQPKKEKQFYESSNVPGYTIKVNTDRKTWTAAFNETPLGESFKSRSAAIQAAQTHLEANPQPASATQPKSGSGAAGGVSGEGAPASAKPKPLVTLNQHNMLSLITKKLEETNSLAIDVSILAKEFGNALTAIGVIGDLGRKKYIVSKGSDISLTDEGRAAMATFTPRPVKTQPDGTPMKSKEERMLDKWGPRPEGIGPRPTALEFEECRLANAQASLGMALMVQRLHPYSPLCAKKVNSSKERVKMIEEKIASLQANPTAEASATPATPESGE